jgi:hypothetical protein
VLLKHNRQRRLTAGRAKLAPDTAILAQKRKVENTFLKVAPVLAFLLEARIF